MNTIWFCSMYHSHTCHDRMLTQGIYCVKQVLVKLPVPLIIQVGGLARQVWKVFLLLYVYLARSVYTLSTPYIRFLLSSFLKPKRQFSHTTTLLIIIGFYFHESWRKLSRVRSKFSEHTNITGSILKPRYHVHGKPYLFFQIFLVRYFLRTVPCNCLFRALALLPL